MSYHRFKDKNGDTFGSFETFKCPEDYTLDLREDEDGEPTFKSADDFWAAMRTVADLAERMPEHKRVTK